MNFSSHALLALVLATFVGATAACTNTCTSDNDCSVDSVCLIDVDGPHCTSIERAAQVLSDSAVPITDDVILRDVSVSLAPEARAGTIVMRPISVVVTRSPLGSTVSTASSNRSSP